MKFLVSNDGIEWSLDFEPDSVKLTIKNLVQEMTISSSSFFRQLGACCCHKDNTSLQPSTPSKSSTYHQTARNYRDAGLSTFNSGLIKHGYKRVSGVQSGG